MTVGNHVAGNSGTRAFLHDKVLDLSRASAASRDQQSSATTNFYQKRSRYLPAGTRHRGPDTSLRALAAELARLMTTVGHAAPSLLRILFCKACWARQGERVPHRMFRFTSPRAPGGPSALS